MTNEVEKRIYVERLVANMRSAGQENWLSYDMHDLCDLANLHNDWFRAKNRSEEEAVVLKAAKILGVEIRHYIPVV